VRACSNLVDHCAPSMRSVIQSTSLKAPPWRNSWVPFRVSTYSSSSMIRWPHRSGICVNLKYDNRTPHVRSQHRSRKATESFEGGQGRGWGELSHLRISEGVQQSFANRL